MKNMIPLPKTTYLIVCLLIMVSCNQTSVPGTKEHIQSVTNKIDDNRLISADKSIGDWLSYGKNYSEDRFSPLSQINKSNIDSRSIIKINGKL